MGVHILETFFARHSYESCTANSHISFISEQHNKSLYIRGHKSCVPRGIPQVTVLVESKKNFP